MTELKALIGKTMVSVTNRANEEIVFTADDGKTYKLYHEQVCCESVLVEDVCGELADLVGAPLVEAEEVSSYEGPKPDYAESHTWTFYKFRTAKGSVTIRWLGESNGYYSESVDFCEVL